jgi:hypothetical protein
MLFMRILRKLAISVAVVGVVLIATFAMLVARSYNDPLEDTVPAVVPYSVIVVSP